MRGAVSMALAYNQVSHLILSLISHSVLNIARKQVEIYYDVVSYLLTRYLVHGAVHKVGSHTTAWERDHDNKYHHCCPFQYGGKYS